MFRWLCGKINIYLVQIFIPASENIGQQIICAFYEHLQLQTTITMQNLHQYIFAGALARRHHATNHVWNKWSLLFASPEQSGDAVITIQNLQRKEKEGGTDLDQIWAAKNDK